jgi:hypothetical protein
VFGTGGGLYPSYEQPSAPSANIGFGRSASEKNMSYTTSTRNPCPPPGAMTTPMMDPRPPPVPAMTPGGALPEVRSPKRRLLLPAPPQGGSVPSAAGGAAAGRGGGGGGGGGGASQPGERRRSLSAGDEGLIMNLSHGGHEGGRDAGMPEAWSSPGHAPSPSPGPWAMPPGRRERS